MTRKIIRLWSMPDEAMVIIEHRSGVWYENQVCGAACAAKEIEGVLAPFDLSMEATTQLMGTPFTGRGGSLDASDAASVDRLLASEPDAAFIKVDRSRLLESCEAWIYVVMDPTGGDLDELRGFGRCHGVLTWPNSD